MLKPKYFKKLSSRERSKSDKGTRSKLIYLSTNPFILLITGFIMTGIVGQYLTSQYSQQQIKLQSKLELERNLYLKNREYEHDDRQRKFEQIKQAYDIELARERTFADKLSEWRINRISDAWEAVFKYDYALESALTITDKMTVPPDLFMREYILDAGTGKLNSVETKQILELRKHEEEIKNIKAKLDPYKADAKNKALLNRFWIGEKLFLNINKYIAVTDKYFNAVINRIKAKENSLQAILNLWEAQNSPKDGLKLYSAEQTYISMDDAEKDAINEINKLVRYRNNLRADIIKIRNEVFKK